MFSLDTPKKAFPRCHFFEKGFSNCCINDKIKEISNSFAPESIRTKCSRRNAK
ncbi:hypothetical protein RUMHYD_00730 [Blautia hydrogenotrophica DSM 10507]|uniref:Uncharacterized protein n=1 Tax=Blautia hydrogenotrophica (strain DSM 10507 / JCM 14656 / S5a33) TaxID=476272 RepID=C0CIR3_BLAHS|nr:hypothetical protein RUMHYD_00730 [Blautia hydrogenotrophica DSM 10507]